jgi:tetratricopeptide (TPR) repeat protein
MGSVNQGAEDFTGTDRFLVQRQLGSGAFGVVYQVYDRRDQSHVALKVLRSSEADALYRFKKDFRSLADLRHPNLVKFYELFTEEGLWFFSMELVPGPDFVEYLTGSPVDSGTPPTILDLDEDGDAEPVVAQRKVPPARDFGRIRGALRQLALGLHTVHRHGKVHRDIKPSNVLVTPAPDAADRVVLLDFGLVTELQQTLPLAVETQLMGTPAYMSPEQALALPGAPASDWYSVGVMLYQVLVGELPFQGTMAEIITAKQVGLPPDPRRHRADLPADLAELSVGLLDPDPETRLPGEEVLRRLDRGAGSAALPSGRQPGSETPFVGREALLAELEEALGASRDGAVAVYLRGASGMGKTALVRKFAEDLRQRDAVVLAGRCYLQESVPYKAFDSLVDHLSHYLLTLEEDAVEELLPGHVAELSRLFPVLLRVAAIQRATSGSPQPAEPAVSRRRAFAALRELLGRLAADRPLVLAVDDLQWGDADSFQLLERLFEPPDPPLLWIGSYRSEDEASSPFLVALAEHRRALIERGVEVHELELGALSAAESQDLVRLLEGEGRDLAAGRFAGLIEEAGGSPLFLAELARRSGSRPAGGERRPPALHLRDLILDRVAGLDPAARRLLRVIAVAGKPVDPEIAQKAAAIRSAAGEALAELRTQRLVRQSATAGREEVETYHDHIREAVVGVLDDDSLRRIHRSLALALELSGRAEPETLAVHFRATAEVERAREYAVSAAGRAEQALAFERAARLYRQALDLLGEDAAERYRLRVRLGAALADAGRSHEAAETYLQAVSDAGVRPELGGQGADDLLEVQRLAAEKLLISGHVDRGLAVLRHVLRHVGMSLEKRPWKAMLRLWLLRLRLRLRGFGYRSRPEDACDPEDLRRIDVCWSVEIGLCLVDVLHASEFHARHLLMALAAGEPRRVARGLAMEIFFGAMDGGDGGDALALSRRVAASVAERYPSCLTEMAAGMAACSRGGWKEAYRRLGRAERQLLDSRSGGAWELDTARRFRVVALLGLGRWPDLFAELPGLLETARAQGNLFFEIHLRHWGESLRHLAEDRPESAEELVGDASRWSQEGFHDLHFGRLHAEVELALYRGHGRAAWRLAESGWAELAESMIQRIEMVLVQSHDLRGRATLAAAARESDRRFRAGLTARVDGDARVLERSGSRWSRGLAAMLRAGVAAAGGDGDRARARLAEAETHFEAASMAVHLAVARRRLAELGGDAAGLAAADRQLEEAGIRDPVRLADVFAPGRWS